jgi:4-amino-4-deoxy-L-arabinose transferase
MPFVFGELVYIPLVWHTALALRRRQPADLALLAWWAVPYAVFAVAATKMPGYVVVAAPALFVIVARFVEFLAALRPARPSARIARGALVVLLVGLPVRYAFERVRPFRTRVHPAWAADLRVLGRTARPPCVIFGERRAIEAMFYTPCTAYPFPARPGDRAALAARGYEVYPVAR